MLYVPLFLLAPQQVKSVGLIVITNDRTGTPQRGNYDVSLLHAGRHWGRTGVYRAGHVSGHDRNGSPYDLLERAIAASKPSRSRSTPRAITLLHDLTDKVAEATAECLP